MSDFWKSDWEQRKENIKRWWRREGPAICISAPADKPWADVPEPPTPTDMRLRWCDADYRARRAEYQMSRRWFGGESFPCADTNIGPGSLGTFLGSEPVFEPTTVWYKTCIDDPENHPDFRFDPQQEWFRIHMEVIEAVKRRAAGRYLTGLPDIIENIDILAQLRDAQTLMLDLLERPRWVRQRVTQLNRVYFDSFDVMRQAVMDEEGGQAFWAFGLWGPGRTAKVQCDASAMFSTEMYHDFVLPALTEQCRWLDYSIYHLDGTQAMHHLDTLLKIDALNGVEWTPQAGIEHGGHARWHSLYKRILDAGKCCHVIQVRGDEVIPLLDACGGNGLYISCMVKTQAEAERILEAADRYRNVRMV